MNYAALSTDIKKSSINWAADSTWMETAVNYHNSIIEAVVNQNKNQIIQPTLLPNAPEGDAYTYFFKHQNLKTLRELVINMGLEIQCMLDDKRNSETPLTIKGYSGKPDFKGQIYIRIGIAFSQEAPFTYYFCRFGPDEYDCRNNRGTVTGKDKSMSYRGSVITMSELAEQKADYKYVPLDKDDTDKCNLKCMMAPSITECYVEDNKFLFRNIVQLCEVPQISIRINDRSSSKPVKGYCIFVEYKRALKDDLVKTNPYARELISKEYASVHYDANTAIQRWLNRHDNYKGGLVKEKRDSSSMYVIKRDGEDQNTIVRDMVDLYETMLYLLNDLPNGSSIGVAFGSMQEKTVTRNNKSFYDYFQTTVNNAARMAMLDFSYASKWGFRQKNGHTNRLAFTSQNNMTKVIEKLLDANVFISIDKIPLKSLNAGNNETITCISSASKGWEPLREGDKVKVNGQLSKISKPSDNGKTYKVDGIRKQLPRRDIIKL